jgi:hypothetical protein
MSKNLRFSEKWFRRLLWCISILFAWFLIGFGGIVIKDLPKTDIQYTSVEDIMDKEKLNFQKDAIQKNRTALEHIQRDIEQADLKLQGSKQALNNETQALQQWLKTRSVVQNTQEDTALIARNRKIEELRALTRADEVILENLRKEHLNISQKQSQLQATIEQSKINSQQKFQEARTAQELKVFAFRLLFVLPIIGLAFYLFKKHRHGSSWPFVWGFGFFSLFSFFFELVPYLPSYGGYVRYGVGILITVLGGRHLIQALQKYLEEQKQKEEMSESEKRENLDRDVALDRFQKGVCPTCERSVDTQNPLIDFCSHCGFSLFKKCKHCGARHNSLELFCHSCGKKHED